MATPAFRLERRRDGGVHRVMALLTVALMLVIAACAAKTLSGVHRKLRHAGFLFSSPYQNIAALPERGIERREFRLVDHQQENACFRPST